MVGRGVLTLFLWIGEIMTSNSVNIGISIPMEMFQWLEKPENKKRINRSRVCQAAFEKVLNPKPEKIHPMSLLVMILGISFGVGSIMAATTMFFSFLFTTTLFLIGATILLAALVTMVKEVREKNATHR